MTTNSISIDCVYAERPDAPHTTELARGDEGHDVSVVVCNHALRLCPAGHEMKYDADWRYPYAVIRSAGPFCDTCDEDDAPAECSRRIQDWTPSGHEVTRVCGTYFAGVVTLCERCNRRAERDYPQGWVAYPGDVCKHGTYTGGCGVDRMCFACEEGL